MRALDRLLLALHAPRARSRVAYRVLVAIAIPRQPPPKPLGVRAAANRRAHQR